LNTLRFRLANHEDIPSILEIYAPYIEETTVTFEYDVPSLEAFSKRFEEITERFPWYVCEDGETVVGYAYASPAFTRAACRWDADLSVYIVPSYHHRGIGKRFYEILEQDLYQMGYHNVYALITGKNQVSCAFHESLGYTLLGRLPRTGFKHGEWLDLYWYGKRLRDATPPSSFPQKRL